VRTLRSAATIAGGTTVAAQIAWQHTDWMWLLGVLMVVVWVALVAAVALLLVTPAGRDSTQPTEQARRILAERYARGELDTEEYCERLDALR
jgi:putative membrane protein